MMTMMRMMTGMRMMSMENDDDTRCRGESISGFPASLPPPSGHLTHIDDDDDDDHDDDDNDDNYGDYDDDNDDG